MLRSCHFFMKLVFSPFLWELFFDFYKIPRFQKFRNIWVTVPQLF